MSFKGLKIHYLQCPAKEMTFNVFTGQIRAIERKSFNGGSFIVVNVSGLHVAYFGQAAQHVEAVFGGEEKYDSFIGQIVKVGFTLEKKDKFVNANGLSLEMIRS